MPRPRDNPPNRFETAHLEWEGAPPPADLHVHEEDTKNALSENKSPDIGFRWSVNPYRGCFHACAYCYARPTHPYPRGRKEDQQEDDDKRTNSKTTTRRPAAG